MTGSLSRADLALKAADEFFDLARKAPTPFMRAYYERVALRYLSSQGELKPLCDGSSGANPVISKTETFACEDAGCVLRHVLSSERASRPLPRSGFPGTGTFSQADASCLIGGPWSLAISQHSRAARGDCGNAACMLLASTQGQARKIPRLPFIGPSPSPALPAA